MFACKYDAIINMLNVYATMKIIESTSQYQIKNMPRILTLS